MLVGRWSRIDKQQAADYPNIERRTPNISQRGAQTGALFGLDARLAMGVFAVLAVVAGYVAFGRIDTARSTALLHELQSLEKALGHYQADMGTFFLFTLNNDPADPAPDSSQDLTALWNPERILPGFRKHFNGPYVVNESLGHRSYGSWGVLYAQGDRQDVCTLTSDCYVWLTLSKVPAAEWKKINAILDENNGKNPETPSQAKALGRVQANADTDPRMLFYRTVKR